MTVTSDTGVVVTTAVDRDEPWIVRRLPAIAVPPLIVASWQVMSMVFGVRVIPSPVMAWEAAVAGVQAGWLLPSIWHTLRVSLIAFSLACLMGVTLGTWLGMSRFWHDVLEGPVLWFFAIPRITLFPLFLLIFGLGTQSQVAFATVGAHLPIAIMLITGIRAIPPIYLRVGKAMGLGKWATFREIIIPAALPSVILGVRYGFSFAFLSVIVAEMFGSRVGAGYQLIRMVALHQVADTFALAALLVAVAFVANGLFVLVQGRLSKRAGVESTGGLVGG